MGRVILSEAKDLVRMGCLRNVEILRVAQNDSSKYASVSFAGEGACAPSLCLQRKSLVALPRLDEPKANLYYPGLTFLSIPRA